ncbi:MAG: hypothetical protein Q8922_15250 [Bacteroidota bacterium]|nr:hypothetical protein [Bacteroidota bacterium]MDP4234058.1 hypothetical protein [Bacteroidota bacterium]MDP4242924.1 hypothetical protein [Bacteroidota bacterium]MDP4289273.1 hypothetical protein [Bacteroidota bacterium]
MQDKQLQKWSDATGIEVSLLRRLIDRDFITGYEVNGQFEFSRSDVYKLIAVSKFPEFANKIALVADRSFMYEYNPELADFLCFHDTIDAFTWLIKLRYSSKEDIRSRKAYRLDRLFDQFLTEKQFEIGKLTRLKGRSSSPDRFTFHLTKGWYNEMVRSTPLNENILAIGTRVSPDSCHGRFAAWNIVQSYYAIYEYVNALVFTNSDNLRTEEHRKSTNYFHKNLLSKFETDLVCYPFNLSHAPAKVLNAKRGEKAFWKFNYARSPRYDLSIYQLEDLYLSLTTEEDFLLNVLYKFRVWANYLGIPRVIQLQDGYYLAHLYKNLGTLCFFYGAFTELMALAFLGEKQVLALLSDFVNDFLKQNENYRQNWYYVPILMRFRFYHKHGLISKKPSYLIPPDPILIKG